MIEPSRSKWRHAVLGVSRIWPKRGEAGSTAVGPKAPMPSAATPVSANQALTASMVSSGVVVGSSHEATTVPSA